MLLGLGALAGLLCPACAPRKPADEVNIADAARTARDTIGNYEQSGADNAAATGEQFPATMKEAPAPAVPSADSTPIAPTGSPPTTENGAGEPAAKESEGAEAAAQVLRTYHRLIAQRRFDDAWALWDRSGQASGMSRNSFAASFAKYRTYTASVGQPGRIEAGAGQRYVTIPVTVTGTLRGGDPFGLTGSMVLHRAGPIDGATAEQRSWRIYQSDLQPKLSPGSAADQITTRFACDDNTTFRARFDNRANDVVLDLPNGRVRLAGQPVASGMHYAGAGYDLRGKGRTVTLTRRGTADVQCREAK
ncbi:membrane-bound lysozyme-inhibitor of c-type lysozyme [Sphingomonas dokdonensis]|uniref:Membrane-bound lysozyme-inhibitor of c-type lysozyme n=1 Tax=Sphingomonas dokdonensis TaxID=344880 RepID=A0A245ZGF8_9SPHN|nr:membrane-bound lysozyme-inhibitor of c-type lysozyme [Sphingomonas dokdonensis]